VTITFDPTAWVTSATRALEDYVRSVVDESFEVQMAFPDTEKMSKAIPFPKTIIHFDQEDVSNPLLGLGRNYVDEEYDETLGTVVLTEAQKFMLSFDVGVWASEASGGATNRMVALEQLTSAFCGPAANLACMARTEGIDIISFGGGRNIIDTINDIPVWRTTDMMLRLRVFAFKLIPPEFYIQGVEQDPGVEVDEVVVVD
jgi:hypothetical protein